MQIITSDMVERYQLNMLTVTFTFEGTKATNIAFSPFNLPGGTGRARMLMGMAERCRSSGATSGQITATCDGIRGSGFDIAMPSYRALSEYIMFCFEELRSGVRDMEHMFVLDDYAETARALAFAVMAGCYDLRRDGLRIQPIDEVVTRAFISCIELAVMDGEPLEEEAGEHFILSGAPSHLPEGMREEIDAKIKEYVLRETCRHLAGGIDRARAAIDAAEAMLAPSSETETSRAGAPPETTPANGTVHGVGC